MVLGGQVSKQPAVSTKPFNSTGDLEWCSLLPLQFRAVRSPSRSSRSHCRRLVTPSDHGTLLAANIVSERRPTTLHLRLHRACACARASNAEDFGLATRSCYARSCRQAQCPVHTSDPGTRRAAYNLDLMGGKCLAALFPVPAEDQTTIYTESTVQSAFALSVVTLGSTGIASLIRSRP
jgi:hypothetical protein